MTPKRLLQRQEYDGGLWDCVSEPHFTDHIVSDLPHAPAEVRLRRGIDHVPGHR
jgi:hypothetical protein